MNHVKIINPSLLNLLIAENNDQRVMAAKSNKRKMSPQQTLKGWIKKGLTHYTNPIPRPKTSLINFRGIQSMQTTKTKRLNDKQNSVFRSKNVQSYDRSSQQSRFPFRRLRTQESDSNEQQIQWVKPQFNEFMKLSDKSMNTIGRQNNRRNFKLHKYRKVKYEDIWKKHVIPQEK